MSGGHFNNNGYIYYQVHQFADELENDIQNNNRPNDWGYAPKITPETLQVLKQQLPMLHNAAKIMKAIDYLYSGDYGEDNFIEVINDLKQQ